MSFDLHLGRARPRPRAKPRARLPLCCLPRADRWFIQNRSAEALRLDAEQPAYSGRGAIDKLPTLCL